MKPLVTVVISIVLLFIFLGKKTPAVRREMNCPVFNLTNISFCDILFK